MRGTHDLEPGQEQQHPRHRRPARGQAPRALCRRRRVRALLLLLQASKMSRASHCWVGGFRNVLLVFLSLLSLLSLLCHFESNLLLLLPSPLSPLFSCLVPAFQWRLASVSAGRPGVSLPVCLSACQCSVGGARGAERAQPAGGLVDKDDTRNNWVEARRKAIARPLTRLKKERALTRHRRQRARGAWPRAGRRWRGGCSAWQSSRPCLHRA